MQRECQQHLSAGAWTLKMQGTSGRYWQRWRRHGGPLLRQCLGKIVYQRLGLFTGQIANQADVEIVGGVGLSMEGAYIVWRQEPSPSSVPASGVA